MINLLGFFTTRTGLAVLAGAALLAALGVSRWQVNSLRADVATANAKVLEFEAAYTVLAAGVADQNAKVLSWESAAKTARENGRQATIEAERRVGAIQSERDRLQAAMAADGDGKTCGDAMNEIRDSLKRMGQI